MPLAALALAAVLNGGDGDLAAGLAPGGKARWLYPTSAIRGLVAYGAVALWLLWQFHRRASAAGFESLLWLAPPAYVAARLALMAPLVLMRGRAAEFVSEQGELVALRLLVRLFIGFGYVALVVFARKRLWPDPAMEVEETHA